MIELLAPEPVRRELQSTNSLPSPYVAEFHAGRALKSMRPAAVIFDDLVNLLHQMDGFAQGYHDLLVMGDVLLLKACGPCDL